MDIPHFNEICCVVITFVFTNIFRSLFCKNPKLNDYALEGLIAKFERFKTDVKRKQVQLETQCDNLSFRLKEVERATFIMSEDEDTEEEEWVPVDAYMNE